MEFPLYLLLGACAGVLVGDSGMFLLGHHFGARILKLRFVARVLTPERYAKVQEKFERYGNRLMFIARFLPGMRTAIIIPGRLNRWMAFSARLSSRWLTRKIVGYVNRANLQHDDRTQK